MSSLSAHDVPRDPELSSRLLEALSLQAQQEPDLYLVSREGRRVPAHRCVLALYTPSLSSLLDSVPNHLAAATFLLPHTSFEALCTLLRSVLVIGPGSVTSSGLSLGYENLKKSDFGPMH